MPTGPQWFEVANGRGLEQGDIILRCPVYMPLVADPLVEDLTIDVDRRELDLIVMTQSCDLVEGREKVKEIVLCSVQTLEIAKATPGHVLSNKNNLKPLIECKLGVFQPLKPCDLPGIVRPFSIVEFATMYALPRDHVRIVASKRGVRPRLKSPYRELMGSPLFQVGSLRSSFPAIR